MRSLFFLFALSSVFANGSLQDQFDPASIEKLISKEEIQQRVEEMGQKITKEYADVDEIAVVALMKGGICIATDLIRSIDHLVTLDFIQTKSYKGTKRGDLVVLGLDELNFSGKDVLVIDDVFDSGNTLYTMVKEIEKQQPKSLRSLVAFNKKVLRSIDYVPDYVLFDIENRFIIGYGMDYDEYLRNLPDVYALPDSSVDNK